MGLMNEWVEELLEAMAESIGDAYQALLLELMKLLIVITFPGVEAVRSEWFSFALGGTFGLATRIMPLLAVILAVWISLTITRSHGKRLSSLLTSIGLLLVMAPAFYPLYTLATNLSRALSLSMLRVGQGAAENEAESLVQKLAEAALPVTPAGIVFLAVFGSLFAGILMLEVIALQVWALVILFVYPMSIALRPVHERFNQLFNALNAGLVTTIFAPPLMVGCLAFVIFGLEELPFAESPTISSVGTLVAMIIAILIPAGMAVGSYVGFSKVVGEVDATVVGAIDVNTMPPLTSDDMNKSLSDAHAAPISSRPITVFNDFDTDADDLIDEVRRMGVNLAATAATSSGHPYVAVGMKAVDRLIPNHAPPASKEDEST